MRVYVAGSYNADNVLGILRNIALGTMECVKLLKAGFTPFCPWLDYQFHFYDDTLTLDDYYRYSIGWLEVSDVLFVLPNSENSKGTQKEIERAKKLGIPIMYSREELDEFKINFLD
jgi:hypothetical protein